MTTLDRSALAAPSRSEDTLAGLFGDDAAGLSEQAAAARVRSALLGEPTRPPQLTRYRLRRVLGEGAMGQVWLADDPQLSREVAIKLVKAPESAHAEVLLRRLAREAKAMARLSHPNVVQIYDVGREPGGGHGAPRLFIVMERVDGETLAQWLATPRPWRDIVRIFAQACDGLAAAHRAGLVHRDFKPGNVFVGRDGRVRVGDFGLARTGATVPAAAAPIDVDAAQLHSTLAGSLTHTGAIVGTPLYMAPEQHAGEAVTPASDQYALCVALFEALAQTRPFAGGLSEVVAAKQARALPTSRRLAAVPEPLLAAVQRGLAPDPRDRFATVEALAEVLRASLRRGPRARWLMLAAAAGTTALWWTLASRGEGCERPRETERAWTPDAREQARAAIAALTQDAHASRALAQIDEHARALADASSAMCQGGTPEPGPLLCLRAHDVQLATTIARIVDGDRTAIELAPRALESLPAPGSCAHDVALHPMPPESFDTELRLRDGLARAKALFDLDAAGESARTARPLYDELVALGEPATELRAEAALQLGNALVVLGRPDEGDAMLRAAYFDATSAGDARVAVRAASGLATLAAHRGDFDDAQRWLRHADAVAPRALALGDNDIVRRSARAMVDAVAGDVDAAAATLRALLELPVMREPSVARNETLRNLSGVLERRGDTTEALALRRLALEEAIALFGEDTRIVAEARLQVANSLMRDGAELAALEQLQQAWAVSEHWDGPDSLAASAVAFALANTYIELSRYPEALVQARAALAIIERREPENHRRRAAIGGVIASALDGLGDRAGALAAYDVALEAGGDADSFEAVQLLASRGYVRMLAGDPTGAVADARAATEVLERVAPQNLTLLQMIASNEAAALRREGHCDEAISVLQRALARDPEHTLEVSIGNLGELAVTQAECGDRIQAHATLTTALEAVPPGSRLRAHLALAEATVRGPEEVAARAGALMLARAIAVRDGDAALLAEVDRAERRDYSRVR